MNGSFRAVTLLLSLIFFCQVPASAEFRYGIDMIASGSGPCACKIMKGKRVGLITNEAAVSREGEPSWKALRRRGIDLRFVMAPEHGFSLAAPAGRKVGDTSIGDSLRVYSLYGDRKSPSPELLRQVDVLAFDLQDVGTRCYTYLSTMKLAMEACDKAGIGFVLFDRPDPVAPLGTGGFVLEPGNESFVGAAGLPMLHGMTLGEIAMWLQKSRYPNLSLQVVRMRDYDRKKFADEIDGFRFHAPSPNIVDLDTAIIYPATVMLEATDVSEGRGTAAPFHLIGAPFINAEALRSTLSLYALPGLEITAASFTPKDGKYAGRLCHGVRFRVTDRKVFDPFRTSTVLLVSLQKLYARQLGLDRHAAFFDQLAGTPKYRAMIVRQASIGEILRTAHASVSAFEASWPDRLLYK